MPRQRKRDTSPEIRFRNMLEAGGLPAMAGRSRVGVLAARPQALQPSTVVDPSHVDEASVTASLTAQLLVMSATADAIASGGDYVTFGSIVSQQGFGDVSAAGSSWVHPVSGVYVITYEHAWDSYTTGGLIELELDGAIPPEGTIGDGSDGTQGRGTIAYRAASGAVGKIKVTQTSGSAQNCNAVLSVSIPNPDEGGMFRRVFAADVYDLAWDGTHWYTTAPPSGTVTKRDTTGASVATFSVDAGLFTVEPRGITYDGANLWIAGGGDPEPVAEYSTAGSLLSDFGTGPGGSTANNGIAYDGSDLWIFENDGDDMEKWTTAGSKVTEFTITGTIGGVAYHDGRLYAMDVGNSQIIVTTTGGASVSTLDISTAVPGATGIWIMADGTLYISKAGDGVYRWSRTAGSL